MIEQNSLGIRRFGPLTFYVDDAETESTRLSRMLQMNVAYVPENGSQIFGLKRHDAIFLLDGRPKAQALARQYGNHVREVGLYVEDAQRALRVVQERCNLESGTEESTGATYVQAPHDGGTYFRFLDDECKVYEGVTESLAYVQPDDMPFQRIDHLVTNTQAIAPTKRFLADVLGMAKVNDFTIRSRNKERPISLYSEVMGLEGSEGRILMPVNEPLDDDGSQIPAQLQQVGRSHIQHIALATDDIIASIVALKSSGMEFLGNFRTKAQKSQYYLDAEAILVDAAGGVVRDDDEGRGTIESAIDKIRSMGILVDRCGDGYLLQLFSKELFPNRSVPFVEIIQRGSDDMGCFGQANFEALADALEQALREQGA